MHLIQKGKTSKNECPLDTEKALLPTSFATYTERTGGGEIKHVALGWTLISTQQGENGKRAKYQDNVFELCMDEAHVDKLIEALQEAKKRFAVAKVPGLVEDSEPTTEKAKSTKAKKTEAAA